MRSRYENKSLTKHEKRGRLLIHIPGAWSNLSTKQVTPTHSVNVCVLYVDILLRPSFGMFCKQQTLYFTLKNHTATLHSGDQVALGLHRFNGVSAILDCKDRK